jgi:hypothetical protein
MFYKGGDTLIKRCLKCEKTKIESWSKFVKKYERRLKKYEKQE